MVDGGDNQDDDHCVGGHVVSLLVKSVMMLYVSFEIQQDFLDWEYNIFHLRSDRISWIGNTIFVMSNSFSASLAAMQRGEGQIFLSVSRNPWIFVFFLYLLDDNILHIR